ncbi:uncharacterized protein LOC144783948 [Lissotriton helveticus]
MEKNKQEHLSVSQINIIKQTLITVILENGSSNFSSFTPNDWKVFIQKDLFELLGSFNETHLHQLPKNITCDSYHEILKGFDMLYISLTTDSKVAVYRFYIKEFLSQKSQESLNTGTGIACETSGITSWVQENLMQFIQQSNIEDLAQFNSNFNKVFIPSNLTAEELAGITIYVDEFKNETLKTLILGRILHFDNNEVFLQYLNTLKMTICLSSNPSTNVSLCNASAFFILSTQKEFLNNTLSALNMNWSLKNMNEWVRLFQIVIELFLRVIDESDLSRLPLNITCEAYQTIIKQLSDVVLELDVNNKRAIYEFSEKFLSQQFDKTGSACTSNTNGTKEWLVKNLGAFFSYASVSKLITLYPNLNIEVLTENLSLNETAVLLAKPEVINNPTLLKQILSLVTPDEVPVYLENILSASEKANLSVSQINTIKQTLITAILENVSYNFSSFTPNYWKKLIQKDLFDLLDSFNETHLHQLPKNISCDSYHEILKGFDMHYISLTTDSKVNVYRFFIKEFLQQESLDTGTGCDASGITSWVEENLMQFIQQSNIEDLARFNRNFSKVFIPSNLTAEELAGITLYVDEFKNATLKTLILSQILHFDNNQVFLQYLRTLKMTICLSSDPSTNGTLCNASAFFTLSTQKEILNNTFSALNMNWSLENINEWVRLFQIVIELFLRVIDESELSRLPLNITCEAYQTIIKQLSDVAPELGVNSKRAIYEFSEKYLFQQFDKQGAACISNINGTVEWLMKNLGAFISYASISKLIVLYPNLSIEVLIEYLSPNETAVLLTKPDVINNSTLLKQILSLVTPDEVPVYLGNILSASDKANLSVSQINTIKQTLITAILENLSSNFSFFTPNDWKKLIQKDLFELLDSFNETHLHQLPKNITCDSYHEILKGFDMRYISLTLESKEAVYRFYIKDFLHEKSYEKGVACETVSFKDWVDNNVGKFVLQATFSDLVLFNQKLNTMTSPANLTSTELADATFLADALGNSTLINNILGQINTITSYGFLSGYLERVTSNFCQNVESSSNTSSCNETSALTQLSLQTQHALVTNTLEVLNSDWSLKNMDQWLQAFKLIFTNFALAINKSNIDQLPLTISCDRQQKIANFLNDISNQLIPSLQNSIFQYLLKYHKDSGLICDKETSFQGFLDKFFLIFSHQMTATDLVALIPPENQSQIINSLKPVELTTILLRPGNTDSTTWKIIVSHYTDISNLGLVLDSLNDKPVNLTNENRIAILAAVWPTFVKALNILSTVDVNLWLNQRLSGYLHFLTPDDLNVSELIPADCTAMKNLALIMNTTYSQFTIAQEQSNFQYLLTFHHGSGLICDTYASFQDFLDEYFLIFSNQMTAQNLVALIPTEKLSEKLNTLRPEELASILTRPKSSIDSATWEILLTHYTNNNNLMQLVDIIRKHYVEGLTNEILTSILVTTWPAFTNAVNTLSAADLDNWLNVLSPYLPFLTAQLFNDPNILNSSCLVLRKLVKTLSGFYDNYTTETQQGIYNVIKVILLQTGTGTKPRCYNASEVKATAWLSNYLGSFMEQTTAADLRSFANNDQLKAFFLDTNNLELMGRLNLKEDVKELIASVIVSNDPSMPITLNSLPLSLICNVIGQPNIELNETSQTSVILQTLNTCVSNSTTLKPEMLTQVINSLDTVSSKTLQSMGPLAVLLTPSTIVEKLNASIIQEQLHTLGTYTSWSTTQTSAIVSTLVQNGFQITEFSIISLGTLATGVPAASLDGLNASEIQILGSNATFMSYMAMAPTALKQRLIQLIISSGTSSVFQSVPDNMANFIPSSRLVVSTITIDEINTKQWTASQAEVFFQIMLKSITIQQYTRLSASVLQGFTCGASNSLNSTTFSILIQAMNGKDVNMPSSQMSCMTKRLTLTGSSTELQNYSNDVLLYVGPDKYSSASLCKTYFNKTGAANINILPQGSAKRQALLSSAVKCLGINANIPKEKLLILGNLSCDLSGSDIAQSDPYILTVLKGCASFSQDQVTAIEGQLQKRYGLPSNWTADNLQEMGNIAGALQSKTLQAIPTQVKTTFFPGFLGQLKKQNMQLFISCLKQLQLSVLNSRAKKDTGTCPSAILTTDLVVTQQDMLPGNYPTASALDACLPQDVLKTNLELFGKMEFSDAQLQTLKTKLDAIFGNTSLDDYLNQLGNIARMYSPYEIGRWNIRNVDTLASLLEKTSWKNDPTKVQALIQRYQQNTNARLDGTVLTVLAPYICALPEEMIKTISDTDILSATTPLDVSSCSQSQKNLLFSKLKAANTASNNSGNAYYQLMKTVISGAPTTDLIGFSKGLPEMELSVFAKLNPEAVKPLSPQTLRDLLGRSLEDINSIKDSDVMQAWANAHNQYEVNSIGLDLVAGYNGQLPDGFIVIYPQTPASGAESSMKILSPLLVYGIIAACVLVASANTFSTEY